MEKHNILEVEGVSKSFGRRQVLNEISFSAEKGKVTSIVGENGSGKTTLLKIIVGMISSDTGLVNKTGRIGYCPQDMQVFYSLTLRENLVFFAMAYGLRNNSGLPWKRIVNNLVDEFQLRPDMDTSVAKLSGGTRQKLNLILALIHSPDLIILDEPYTAFDWESYLYFWKLVEAMKQKDTSFLIVSHLVYDRKNIDQIFELKKGRLA